MKSLAERNMELLTVPLPKDVRRWLRFESKRTRTPQGAIIAREILKVMPRGWKESRL